MTVEQKEIERMAGEIASLKRIIADMIWEETKTKKCITDRPDTSDNLRVI